MVNKASILTVGNCQAKGIGDCIAAILGRPVDYFHQTRMTSDQAVFDSALDEAQLILAQTGSALALAQARITQTSTFSGKVVVLPRLFFSGFHPDVVYPGTATAERRNPLGNNNSAILLAAWREGLSLEQALSLFREDVYAELGYLDFFPEARKLLLEECAQAGFDASSLFDQWMRKGTFMYIPLHPHLSVLDDIARTKLVEAGMLPESDAPTVIDDELAGLATWPVYPEIARILGVPGDYIFHPKNTQHSDRPDLQPMDLETFVTRSYAFFNVQPPELSAFDRLSDQRLHKMKRFVRQRSAGGTGTSPSTAFASFIGRFIGRKPSESPKVPATSTALDPVAGQSTARNPYKNLPDFHWWNKAVAAPVYSDVDPVVQPKFIIGRTDRIATAGSCFAQHIAKRLQREGYNYLVAEQAPHGLDDPIKENYGVFSARFGNLYTTRQLVQLLGRAYGTFVPKIDCWQLPDGKFVDPFRPRIASQPFNSVEELTQSREIHLAAVRSMIETLDVFVFTLGLTEAWCARDDGAVVPLAPGVMNAQVSGDAYVAKNFSTAEISADIDELVKLLKRLNPTAKILLTVSPVPLIATFEEEHVLTATTYSKSVLRVAAGDAAKQYEHVAYFPSFEIITGSYSRGRYFADDLREVTEEGVSHVMRLFMQHYADAQAPAAATLNPILSGMKAGMEIICDEEEIGRAVQH